MGIKVTVIIPTYNRAGILRETLNSLLAQTLTDWECIVVDDGSNDNTCELLKEYQERDSRFIYLQRPSYRTKGASSCRNIGLENAKGEFVQFLDSDDLISANKLKDQVHALEKNGKNSIATCKWGYFTTINEQLTVEPYRPTHITTDKPIKLFDIYGRHSTFFPQHVFLVRKETIERAGYWNEVLTNNDDAEFFTRVLLNSSKIIFVPTAEAYYRTGTGNNLSTRSSEEKVKSLILSYELIDAEIKKKVGVSNHMYIRQAKYGIFKKLKNSFPRIIEEHPEFFNTRKSKVEYVYTKVLSKLQIRICEKISKYIGNV